MQYGWHIINLSKKIIFLFVCQYILLITSIYSKRLTPFHLCVSNISFAQCNLKKTIYFPMIT